MGFIEALIVLVIIFKVRPKTLLGNWFRFTGAFTLYIFFLLLKEARRDPPPLFLYITMPLFFGVVIGSAVFGLWFLIKKIRKK